MRNGLIKVTMLAAAALAVGAAPSMAATLTVAPQKSSTGCAKTEQYTSIQHAINAAHAGDVINVCPGTYQEQLFINKSLTLQSTTALQATIKAPATLSGAPTAIVTIHANNVKLTGFTITSSAVAGGTSPGSLEYGVYITAGSATLNGNDISDIEDDPLSGDQTGVAVEAGDSSIPSPGSVTMTGNTIENYQKGGITVDGTGSVGDIVHNTIMGVGPTTQIAQNGIQISDGATATVTTNTVNNNIYTGNAGAASTGILLYAAGSSDVESNVLSTDDVGYYECGTLNSECASTSDGPANPTSAVKYQIAINSTYDGIALDAVPNAPQLNGNTAVGTWYSGNGLDLFDGTSGALVQSSTALGNIDQGIYAETGSTGNTFKSNSALTNLGFDCLDDTTGTKTAGTANTWTSNTGDVNSPQAICTGNPAVRGATTNAVQANSLQANSLQQSQSPAASGADGHAPQPFHP